MGRGGRRDERGGLLDLGGRESGVGRDEMGRLEGGAIEPAIMHLPCARGISSARMGISDPGQTERRIGQIQVM